MAKKLDADAMTEAVARVGPSIANALGIFAAVDAAIGKKRQNADAVTDNHAITPSPTETPPRPPAGPRTPGARAAGDGRGRWGRRRDF